MNISDLQRQYKAEKDSNVRERLLMIIWLSKGKTTYEVADLLDCPQSKVMYWKSRFENEGVDGCPVPVVMAGGPKVDTEKEVFDFVHYGIQKGAIGVNLGRNIWQNEHPVPMIKALRAIIHEDATSDEASDIFEELKKGGE